MNKHRVGAENRDRIVVIGGGVAGLAAVKELQKRVGDTEIVLIEPREYAEVPFAVLRGLVDPTGIGQSMRKPLSELTTARHIAAKAIEISGNEVVLETGERIQFSQAIVATGSTTRGYPFMKGGTAPTVAGRQQEFNEESRRLRDAKSVLIIGGGPIGVELAGEINSAYPDKPIALVQGTDRLLPALPEGAGKKAARVLTKRGIEVVLGTYLDERDGRYTDADGRDFAADLVYKAVGIRTNAIPVDGPASINDKNQLVVGEKLRVHGRDNVFAVGDVNDVPEIKLGATGAIQAGVAVRNIVALRSGDTENLKTYTPAKPIGLVTFGTRGGLAQLPFGRLDFMVAMKQKDMFVSRYLGS